MADHCQLCDTRRPTGGTNHLVLNGGELWIEFCQPCGKVEEVTSSDTGETITVQALFDRCAGGRAPRLNGVESRGPANG